MTSTLDLPGISNPNVGNYTPYEVGGIDFDLNTGSVYVAANNADAFASTISGDYSKANFTVPNHILRYDTRSNKLTDVNLSGAQAEFKTKTGGNLTNGFQDMAEDRAGNSYAIGTFGNSIVKIPAGSSNASLWYATEPYSPAYGFGGIVALDDLLVVSDTASEGFVTFQTKASEPQAVYVKPSDVPANLSFMADGLFAPTKYSGKVLLWSNDYTGTVVYGSEDNWKSARYVGLVPNEGEAQGGLVTDAFEIGENLFVVSEFFQAKLPPETKTSWKFLDITQQVEAVVRASSLACK